MFRGSEALAAVVDDVAVAATGEAIAAARRQIDRLEAKVAAAEAEYVKGGGFEVDGYGSMAAFLRLQCHMTVPESRRVASRAAKLAAWPDVTDAWLTGDLNGAQVDVMCAKVPLRHVERFAITAAESVEAVASFSPGEVHHQVEQWVSDADDIADREAEEAGTAVVSSTPEREVFVSRSLDDIRFLNGTLDPDSGVLVETALQAAATVDVEGERRTPGQRRADALVEVCRFYVAHHQNPPNTARPDRLVLTADVTAMLRAVLRGAGVVTAEQLETFLSQRPDMGLLERGLFLDAFDGHGGIARTLDGAAVSDTLLAYVTSNGLLERLLMAEGRILEHGRAVREFTDAQRRAILARDQGCRVEGCDAGPERCDIHHVNPWEDGGTTDITNAVAKCHHEHLKHHRERWTDHLEPNGTYTVTSPTGTVLTTRPPGKQASPTLPLHTISQPAPVIAFVPVCDERIDVSEGHLDRDSLADDHRVHTDDEASAADRDVRDDDLLMAITTLDEQDWIVIAETAQELSDTITSMVTTAA